MKLTIVGDIFPGEEEITIGYGIKSLFQNGEIRHLWQSNIQELLGDTDCAIGNLESPLLNEDKRSKDSFYGVPEFAEFLKDCGFRILNVANNHILEHGQVGFQDTLYYLKKNGIAVIGIGDEKNMPDITVVENNGIKMAITAFCDQAICSIPHIEGSYNELDEKRLVLTVKKMNDIVADIRIVVLHWGNEYVQFPSVQQRDLAHKLIDLGVDLIIGHHSHCIQPYEKYGRGHIFYSLGNFCFEYLQSDMVKMGLIAQLNITNRGIEQIELRGVEIYDTIFSDNLVRLSSSEKFNRIYNAIDKNYQSLQLLDRVKYEKVYMQTLRHNRLFERINMRIWIIKGIFCSSFRRKRLLIRNIWNFICKKRG